MQLFVAVMQYRVWRRKGRGKEMNENGRSGQMIRGGRGRQRDMKDS